MADYTLSCDSPSLGSTLSIIYYISVYVKGFFNKNQKKTHIYLSIIKFNPRPLTVAIVATLRVRVRHQVSLAIGILATLRVRVRHQISLAVAIVAKG